MKTRDYYEKLREDLKDEKQAAAYLDAALDDGNPEVLLLALRNVVLAHGGIQALSRKTNLHRVNLNRMLSERGNPELKSLATVFRELGFRLRVEPSPRTKTGVRPGTRGRHRLDTGPWKGRKLQPA